MSKELQGGGSIWSAVLERFEQQAPASVMARTALEQALPADWIDAVFESHRQSQYTQELLFSTVVELMMRVAVGLRPSLHAAARQADDLPVSLAALYDKVRRTEPEVLRALVRGSAERLTPVLNAVGAKPPSLPGFALRVLDGNHLPASQKRLKALRGHRGAALPGQALVVYDPDSGLATDLVAGEDAYTSERSLAPAALDSAGPGQVWVADRHFCTRPLLDTVEAAGACFVVREHGNHPRLTAQGDWQACGRTETGTVREQSIRIGDREGPAWRRIALTLDRPTEAGEQEIRLWSNLPAEVEAGRIAQLYRRRWRIEGLFQRLETVLHSEVGRLGHPRAALLGFASAVLAYNVLALLERCLERAHAAPDKPPLSVSLFHLAHAIRSGYDGLAIALEPAHEARCRPRDATALATHLIALARRIKPSRIATRPRGPKRKRTNPYVSADTARAHVATARVLAKAKLTP